MRASYIHTGIPQTLIKVALIFSVVLSGLWAILAFIGGQFVVGIIGVIFFAMACCYAYFAWSRIPFATANLVTAITAIKANCGIAIYTYLFAALSAGWLIVWSLAFIGVFDKTYTCDPNTNVCNNPAYGYLFLLFLALYFVGQAIQVKTTRRMICLVFGPCYFVFLPSLKTNSFHLLLNIRVQGSIHCTVAGMYLEGSTVERLFEVV